MSSYQRSEASPAPQSSGHDAASQQAQSGAGVGPGVAGQSTDQSNALACEQLCDANAASDPALQAFLGHGPFGPSTLQAPTGIGGFDAEYHPGAGQLVITVRGSVNLMDGLTEQSGSLVANHTDLDQAAIDGNLIADPAARAAFLADFQWGQDTSAWVTKVQGNVERTWSNHFSFWVDKPGWECVIASVLVDIDMVEGMSRPNDHVNIEAYKCPDDGAYDVGAYVASGTGGTGNSMVLSSRDGMNSDERTQQGGSLLQREVGPFGVGSARLSNDNKASLDAFAADFLDANNDGSNPITLVGRASSDGAAAQNERLARQRAEAVSAYLRAKGVAQTRITVQLGGTQGADASEAWRRVDLVVGDGRAQDVASHEFGHVLGLTDHYDDAGSDADGDGVADRGGTISGTGAPAGTLAGHDNLAKQIGVSGGAVYENNDNIMSLGCNVAPANYATIGWALQTVTSVPEWKING